jgi:hypothetical protein
MWVAALSCWRRALIITGQMFKKLCQNACHISVWIMILGNIRYTDHTYCPNTSHVNLNVALCWVTWNFLQTSIYYFNRWNQASYLKGMSVWLISPSCTSWRYQFTKFSFALWLCPMISGSLSPWHGASSGCGWRNGLQLWRVAANILNKQSRTADKGWSSSLGVGRGANNYSP